MKISKTTAGFLLVGGLVMTVFGWQVAGYASGHVGAPSDDLYYDCISWTGTIVAIVGLAMFFWGAKRFAAGAS